ncbi:MAG: hypothetical protein HYU41_25785 [Candidatus Rokubacteria bacterium]|nr:hypothetical protein [Candidatus Rokubacteria bacterium]
MTLLEIRLLALFGLAATAIVTIALLWMAEHTVTWARARFGLSPARSAGDRGHERATVSRARA